MSDSVVSVRDEGTTRILTLNRPSRRNAITDEVVNALGYALSSLVGTTQRSVVITGAGKTFCSGQDLSEPPDLENFALLLEFMETVTVPVIVALNGDAYGGGAGLALVADLVIADESARIGFPEVRRGLVPVIVLPYLMALSPLSRVRELVMTGEPIDSKTAQAWGLISRVVPDSTCLGVALEFGRKFESSGPQAQCSTKRMVNATKNLARLRLESHSISEMFRKSPEGQEGIRAFLERRPPRWRPWKVTFTPGIVRLPGFDWKSLEKDQDRD